MVSKGAYNQQFLFFSPLKDLWLFVSAFVATIVPVLPDTSDFRVCDGFVDFSQRIRGIYG